MVPHSLCLVFLNEVVPSCFFSHTTLTSCVYSVAFISPAAFSIPPVYISFIPILFFSGLLKF